MPDNKIETKAEKLLEKLVHFDTTSSKSNLACIHFIRDYLKDHSIHSELLANQDNTKSCLFASIGPKDKAGLVLAGHTDVVPVEGQDWASDPFTLTARDGKLFGRGSCDMKAFIACVLAVIPEFSKEQLTHPIHLAFTYDEETDMGGAVKLTEYLESQKIKPAWVWIGEPTSLRIINSHKGVALFKTNIRGVPGHSGQPDKGLNAIDCGNKFLTIIQNMAGKKKAKPFNASRFDPPYTTFNLGIIKGGTAENIIAEHCEIDWQARAHPGDNLGETIQTIKDEATATLGPCFSAFAPHAGMTTCTCFDIPALMPTEGNPGESILGKLTGNPETEAVSFATEAGFFQKLGTHVVVCGPGSIDQAHKPNEFVEESQLTACVDLIRQVLLCSAAK